MLTLERTKKNSSPLRSALRPRLRFVLRSLSTSPNGLSPQTSPPRHTPAPQSRRSCKTSRPRSQRPFSLRSTRSSREHTPASTAHRISALHQPSTLHCNRSRPPSASRPRRQINSLRPHIPPRNAITTHPSTHEILPIRISPAAIVH
ncbi:hypothetical protein RYX36_012454 [Vicia faba]